MKCDKTHPCTNCQKAAIECIYPKPGRAPRRSKKTPDSELLARLRRLEGVVQKMGKTVDGADIEGTASSTSETGRGSVTAVGDQSPSVPSLSRAATSPSISDRTLGAGPSHEGAAGARGGASGAGEMESAVICSIDMPREEPYNHCSKDGVEKVNREMGRLVVGQGRSRYVSNKFWATLTEEVSPAADMRSPPARESVRRGLTGWTV